MERKLLFKISQQDTNLTIYDYLKAQGFSSQNIIDLKKLIQFHVIQTIGAF